MSLWSPDFPPLTEVATIQLPSTYCYNTYWIKIKDENNLFAGYISSAVWSPEFKKNIALGLVEKDFWNKEINLYIVLDNNEKRKIVLKDDFWS